VSRFEISLGDPNYPQALLSVDRPPRRLYGMGDSSLLDTATIGIIGARKATPYGIRATRLFAEWLASKGLTIVSGAAIGCDKVAHESAISAGTKSIAVLGCGSDVDYPASSAALLKIMRSDHLVVSEREWSAKPTRWALRIRNRIIAALSDHLLVVEAGLPSGTFSTVDYKINGSGMVFVVPGSIFSPSSRGCNRLIGQGAYPVCEVSDLAMYLGLSEVPEVDNGADADLASNSVYAALLAQPMRPDDLAFELGMDIVSVAQILYELENTGKVSRGIDGRYYPR